MHHEVDQQHAVHHNSHPYQVDLDADMQGTTRMTEGTQITGITIDSR